MGGQVFGVGRSDECASVPTRMSPFSTRRRAAARENARPRVRNSTRDSKALRGHSSARSPRPRDFDDLRAAHVARRRLADRRFPLTT